MGYWKYFSRDTILASMQGDDLHAILEELLGVLTKSKKLTPAAAKKVRTMLLAKVEQGATGAIGHGVAIPHVKIPQAKSTVAALGRIPDGVDFRAGDGQDVTLCFFVVGPEDAPEEHLDLLRWIASLARDQDFPRFALRCSSQQELIDLLKEMSGG